MKKCRFLFIICLFISIFILSLSCSHHSDEYVIPLTVANRTSMTLKIYVKYVYENIDYLIGTAPTKKTITFDNSRILRMDLNDILIEAKSEAEEIIYSKIFHAKELEDLNFKITIE